MSALEVPAVIAGEVNLLKFTEALARVGLVGRHDATRGVLVIEPADRQLGGYRATQVAKVRALLDACRGARGS